MQYFAPSAQLAVTFAVLLADDFLTDYEPGVTSDLVRAFARSGKLQLSVMEVDGSDISKYGVVVPNESGRGIAGLVEKPDVNKAPSNLASIGRYLLTADIFDTIRGLQTGLGGNSFSGCNQYSCEARQSRDTH